jgi:hypothetical protein
MSQELMEYDDVALPVDIPDEGVYRGQVGTILDMHTPEVFEVEFSDQRNGHTIALLALHKDQLLRLRYKPGPSG